MRQRSALPANDHFRASSPDAADHPQHADTKQWFQVKSDEGSFE